MTLHLDLCCAFDWLTQLFLAARPIRSTTWNWHVISMEFLYSFLKHQFTRKPLVCCKLLAASKWPSPQNLSDNSLPYHVQQFCTSWHHGCIAFLTHKNPKGWKIIHDMCPIRCRDQSVWTGVFVQIPCSCNFCGGYYGCCLMMHILLAFVVL